MGRGDARSDSDDSVQWEEFFGPSLEISGSLLAMYDSLASELRSDGSSCQPPPACRPLSSSSDCSSSSSSSSSLLPPGLGGVKKSYLASVESLEDDIPPALRGNRTTLCRTAFADNSAAAMHRSLLGHSGNVGCGPDQPSYLDRVLLEVVDTERTYVRDIGAIVEGYLKPLSQLTDSKIKPEELKSLFGNIETIYAFNSGFLAQLEKCGFDPVSIARCFVANSSGFAVYTEFCTSYPIMVSTLTELVGKAETAEMFKMPQQGSSAAAVPSFAELERRCLLHEVLPRKPPCRCLRARETTSDRLLLYAGEVAAKHRRCADLELGNRLYMQRHPQNDPSLSRTTG